MYKKFMLVALVALFSHSVQAAKADAGTYVDNAKIKVETKASELPVTNNAPAETKITAEKATSLFANVSKKVGDFVTRIKESVNPKLNSVKKSVQKGCSSVVNVAKTTWNNHPKKTIGTAIVVAAAVTGLIIYKLSTTPKKPAVKRVVR